jgi:hypothetical protein
LIRSPADASTGHWKHWQVDDPHSFADLCEATTPVPNLFDSSPKGEGIGSDTARSDAIGPNNIAISGQPPNQVLATRRMTPPVVGKNQQRRMQTHIACVKH